MRLVDGNLVLREIEQEDNAFLKGMINSPEMESLVGGWSFPVSEMAQQRWYEHICMDGNNVRYIMEFEGTPVGMASITGIDWKNSVAELNIKIADVKDKGKGIGYRTIRLLEKYSFGELNLHCLYAVVLEENAPSRRLFEKCGFVMEGKRRGRVYKGGRYHCLCDYSILKEEFSNEGDRQ